MKKIIVFFAVCAMALCAASCNKKQEPTEFYEWELKCPKEDYLTDETQYNDVKSWVDAALKQISPLTSGSGDLSKSQLQSTISNAENAMAKVVTDFEETRKTHDFGPYYYKSIRYFHVLDRPAKEIYKSPEYTIDYQALPRAVSEYEVNEPNFSTKVMIAEEFALAPTVGYLLLHLEPGLETKIVGEPRVYNAETQNIYTGTPFVSAETIQPVDKGLLITMKFYRAHAEEYLGSWYMLIPVEQKGALTEKVEVLVKITLK